jgi:thiol-disulfide isomerase/thioredoxin
MHVEVVGVEPPCNKCKATLKNVEEVASKIRAEGINIRVSKLNMASEDVIAKYGVLVSPSLVVNGVVKVVGRVPDKKEVERILRSITK